MKIDNANMLSLDEVLKYADLGLLEDFDQSLIVEAFEYGEDEGYTEKENEWENQ